MPRIDALKSLTPTDRSAILFPLDEFTRNRGFVWEPQSFALVLRDDANQIVGGLIGGLEWGWLRIDILSVASAFRGTGWGRRLVEDAEQLAIAAGCHSAWVDTFSFQSPGFYLRMGYLIFAELPNYPMGETRFFLTKSLSLTGNG